MSVKLSVKVVPELTEVVPVHVEVLIPAVSVAVLQVKPTQLLTCTGALA